MMQKETELRELIIDYLKKKYDVVQKDRQMPRRPGFGTVKSAKGAPDIWGCTKRGQLFCIEVKNPNGTNSLSQEQEVFLAKVNRNHGIGIVAFCLEDVTSCL